jgi:hypothetical protein
MGAFQASIVGWQTQPTVDPRAEQNTPESVGVHVSIKSL